MTKIYLLMLAFIPMFTAANETLTREARQKTQALATALKSTLQQSMQTQGPIGAVEVCHTQAIAITKNHHDAQWTIGRTALKVRNPDNAPDSWETSMLDYFNNQIAKGVDASQLEVSRLENGQFRYMKAIPTGPACLACHGSNIHPELMNTIRSRYPDDKATGFSLGELRGAFTLTKQLP